MRTKHLLLTAALGFAALPSLALDVANLITPARLSDNAITIGGRTLQLPAGDWTLVTEHKGSANLDGLPNARTSTVYLALLREKRLLASIVLTLPETSLSSSERIQWGSNRCEQAKGYLFRDNFESGWRTPACLLVYDRTDPHRENSPLMAATRTWLADEGINTRAPYYLVTYSKNGERDFGIIHILFPEKSVDFSAEVGNWANQLHDQLPRLFERRDQQATLPALPLKP